MDRQSSLTLHGLAALMTEDAEFATIAPVAKTQGRGEVAATLLTDISRTL